MSVLSEFRTMVDIINEFQPMIKMITEYYIKINVISEFQKNIFKSKVVLRVVVRVIIWFCQSLPQKLSFKRDCTPQVLTPSKEIPVRCK